MRMFLPSSSSFLVRLSERNEPENPPYTVMDDLGGQRLYIMQY